MSRVQEEGCVWRKSEVCLGSLVERKESFGLVILLRMQALHSDVRSMEEEMTKPKRNRGRIKINPPPKAKPLTSPMPSPKLASNSPHCSIRSANPNRNSRQILFSPPVKSSSVTRNPHGAVASCVASSTFGSMRHPIGKFRLTMKKHGCISPPGSSVPVVA